METPMSLRQHAPHLPGRLVSGAFILHSGLEKWKAGREVAEGTHGMASTAFPALAKLPPTRFLKVLAASEIALGAALLVPVVPARVAGAGLTGFSAALLGLYAKVPGLREPGSVWPTQQGMAVAKDVWLLGIGLGLMAVPSASAAGEPAEA
jgi:uncharacterized membrane protein YphA (DoxX/SURF4 family)